MLIINNKDLTRPSQHDSVLGCCSSGANQIKATKKGCMFPPGAASLRDANCSGFLTASGKWAHTHIVMASRICYLL